MKIQCPACVAAVPAENIDLEKGWGKCSICNEVFPLADVLPDYPSPTAPKKGPIPRPFNAGIIAQRSPDGLTVYVPAAGMRAATWGVLGMSIIFLAFTAFWTATVLNIGFGQGPPQPARIVFACFGAPFWLAGLGGLASVAWSAWTRKMLHLGPEETVMRTQCLVWSRTRSIATRRVEQARPYRPMAMSTPSSYPSVAVPSFSVEIVYEKGSYVLPAESEQEQEWLIQEINTTLEAARS